MTIGIVRFVLQCLLFLSAAPFKRIRFCLKMEIFSSEFAHCPRLSGENGKPKTHLFKNVLHSEDFFENAGHSYVYVKMDENEGFRIR